MEWSSDGYVLAVGWQHGWAIFSVGGRCLAWGFGVEDPIDEDKSAMIRQNVLLLLFADTILSGFRMSSWMAFSIS